LLISRQDRVQIWASQLAANDFPPVCAVTGAPAETWRKFRFSTPPPWAYALLVLIVCGVVGILVGSVVMMAVSEKASGHLPLTRASSRLVGLAIWIPSGLILASIALWTLVAIAAVANVDASDPNAGAVGAVFIVIGVLMLLFGLIGRLVVMPLVSPRGRVTVQPGYYDKLVEIRNVHPAFVAAVTQILQARAQQYVSTQPQANAPLPPGPN
jgi:NADH:ubiquinone oxidoreductase subunit 6 (subunit J)